MMSGPCASFRLLPEPFACSALSVGRALSAPEEALWARSTAADGPPIEERSPKSVWRRYRLGRSLLDGGTVCRGRSRPRSEEPTSELQSPDQLVCRLLLAE